MSSDVFLEALLEGMDFVHHQGYKWFKEEFLSVVEESNKRSLTPSQKAHAFYLAANIYGIHEAPVKAKYYYKKSLEFDSSYFDAHLEIAEAHAHLGEFEDAARKIIELKSMDARRREVLELENDIFEMRKENPNGFYSKGDLIWEMNEEMANENFDAVIDTFAASNNTEELLILARAFGAINDGEGYLSVWEELSKKKGEIDLDFADWFYLPNEAFEDAEIWELLRSMVGRITDDSVFMVLEGLEQHYGNKGLKRLRELTCEYNIARSREDKVGLEVLKKAYPMCQEFK